MGGVVGAFAGPFFATALPKDVIARVVAALIVLADGTTTIMQYVSTGLTVAAGAWHHVSGSYDGTTVRVSYDGTIESSSVGTNKGPVDGSTKLQVGRTLDGGGGKNWLSGKIDEVRISNMARYTAAFTPAQSFTVDGNTKGYWKFNENTGTTAADSSGNALTLTLTGAGWGTGVSTGSKAADDLEDEADAGAGPLADTGATEEIFDTGHFYANGEVWKTLAATTPSWTQEFSYDRWGNRAWGSGTTAAAKGPDTQASPSTNRLTLIATYAPTYDAAGNLTSDASNRTLSYDAENRMFKAIVASTTTTYAYDGMAQGGECSR